MSDRLRSLAKALREEAIPHNKANTPVNEGFASGLVHAADRIEAALTEQPDATAPASTEGAISGVVSLPNPDEKKCFPAIVKGCEGYKCVCCNKEPTPRHLKINYVYTPLCEDCIAKLVASGYPARELPPVAPPQETVPLCAYCGLPPAEHGTNACGGFFGKPVALPEQVSEEQVRSCWRGDQDGYPDFAAMTVAFNALLRSPASTSGKETLEPSLTLKQVLEILYHGRTMVNFSHVPSVTRAIDWLSQEFRDAAKESRDGH